MLMVTTLFIASCALNVLWLALWHFEMVGVSFVVIVAEWLVLAALYLNVRRTMKTAAGWVPVSIYTAWVTVATLANMAILVTRLLDGGVRAFAFASGLAAVTACFSLLQSGDEVVISDDIYGGTYRLLEQIFGGFGIRFLLTDFGDPAAVEAKLSERTKMVYFETPTNPMMRVADIRRIAALAKRAGAVTVVDNTFLTPYFQRPLELGADITLYSATKFLCGHHDTSAGLLVTSDASLAERLALISRTEGAALSPFDAFLIQRGMKTLALRMEKHQQNACAVTAFLKTQPAVAEVFYPGDEDSPYYALSRSQSTGFGGMLSFTLRTREQALALLERVKLIKYAESLGGTESLITYPLTQTHASTPAPLREKLGITDRLVRLSVGMEQEKDIIDDLFVALRA